MTERSLALLCAFAAIDLPAGARGRLGALAGALMLESDEKELLLALQACPETRELMLEVYVNRNDESGFAACAFRAPDGSVYAAFRGSEARLNDRGIPVDWTDNLFSPLSCSLQYPDAEAFAARFAGQGAVFTGHSKGGHNALFALSSLNDPGASAVAFNAQGFAPGQLSSARKKRLRERSRNLVAENDVVGPLLYHPERRRFTRSRLPGLSHSLSAFVFSPRGRALPGHRPLWSRLLGGLTLLLAIGLRKNEPSCGKMPEAMPLPFQNIGSD